MSDRSPLYPRRLQARSTGVRRTEWARQYIDAIIQRDVRDVAGVDKLDRMPRLLRALAHASGQLSNYTQLGAKIGLDHKSVARYVGVLENMFLLARVPPFAQNRLKRVVRTETDWTLCSKHSSTGNCSSMHRLAEAVRSRFTKGIVLYDGTEALPLGDHLQAAPLSSLWGD